jgi:hypothetical protein
MKKLLCTLILATLGTAVAKADEVTITFDQPTQTGVAGQTLDFFGTITNDTSDTIYFNSDSLNFGSPGFTQVDQFFNTVPVSLAAGDSSSDIELFDISVNNPFGNTLGIYSGTYTLVGGDDDGAGTAQDYLGSASFAVDVTPEPASIYLLLGGLAGVWAPISRRTRASRVG